MNWLSRLKNLKSTPAVPLQKQQKGVSAVFVGADQAPFQNSEGDDAALMAELLLPANDPATPDDTVMAQLALFTSHGLNLDEAQEVVEVLAERDRCLDDRRLCLECRHLYGGVEARRCSQWRTIGIGSPAIPVDLVTILQRCPGFHQR